MRITRVHVLATLALVVAVILIALVPSRFRVVVKQTPVTANVNPLKLALEYESSDEKFEELVKKYPEWISYRSDNKGSFNWQILADCAFLKRTNYVRILIANGADVEEAVKSLKEVGSDEAIKLLRQVQSAKSSRKGP